MSIIAPKLLTLSFLCNALPSICIFILSTILFRWIFGPKTKLDLEGFITKQ